MRLVCHLWLAPRSDLYDDDGGVVRAKRWGRVGSVPSEID